jgi:hypothetical protein
MAFHIEWFVMPSKVVKSCHRPRWRTSKAWFADREEITKKWSYKMQVKRESVEIFS